MNDKRENLSRLGKVTTQSPQLTCHWSLLRRRWFLYCFRQKGQSMCVSTQRASQEEHTPWRHGNTVSCGRAMQMPHSSSWGISSWLSSLVVSGGVCTERESSKSTRCARRRKSFR